MRSIINTGLLCAAFATLMAGCPWDEPAVVGDCASKSCGQSCNNCGDDPNCYPSPDMFCHEDGMCAAGTPLCGAESPCSVELCPANTVCVVLSTNPPVTNCVYQPSAGVTNQPSAGVPGVSCGDDFCSQGEVCCNASCGICTPAGGACTQQLCDATE